MHYRCEGGIEKSVLRITVWHHEACRIDDYSICKMMVNSAHFVKSTPWSFKCIISIICEYVTDIFEDVHALVWC